MANTIPREKLQIIATATYVYYIMPLFSLTASKIDRNVSIAVPVIAVINEMNYSHWISLKQANWQTISPRTIISSFSFADRRFKRRLDCTTPTSSGWTNRELR